MRSPLVSAFIFGALLCAAASLRAQVPFYTDDADTTARGKFHLEFFNEHDVLQRELYPARRQNTANFTLNYGLTDQIELDINAPLITIYNARTSPLGKPFGVGDTQFGVKYNFRKERESSRLPAMTAAFYIEAPTGDTRKQIGSGVYDYWLYGVAQKSLSDKTKLRTNAGILFAGNTSTGLVGIRTTRGKVFTGNASLVRDVSDKLKLGIETFGAVTSTFELSKGQLESQFGGNYKLQDNLTLNFGLLAGRFVASPRVGAQIGFSYDFK